MYGDKGLQGDESIYYVRATKISVISFARASQLFIVNDSEKLNG
jgi:hypothetical protein